MASFVLVCFFLSGLTGLIYQVLWTRMIVKIIGGAPFAMLWSLIYNQVFSYFMLYNLLTFVGCTILLIIPVTCMGATLPVLCRFYVTSLSHIGTHAGRLYGLNTIGAAVGALLAGFVLLYSMGMWGSKRHRPRKNRPPVDWPGQSFTARSLYLRSRDSARCRTK
jgi:hypothetical protein